MGLLFQLCGGSPGAQSSRANQLCTCPIQTAPSRRLIVALRFPDPGAAGSGPGAASSSPQIPVDGSYLPFYVSAKRLGEGQVLTWGPRAGTAEPEFKLIPALSSDLLSTYCVPGTQP